MGSIIDKQYRAAIFRDWSYIGHVSSFVDIGEIVDHHCLNFLYIKT
jgi:hypothetical protein